VSRRERKRLQHQKQGKHRLGAAGNAAGRPRREGGLPSGNSKPVKLAVRDGGAWSCIKSILTNDGLPCGIEA